MKLEDMRECVNNNGSLFQYFKNNLPLKEGKVNVVNKHINSPLFIGGAIYDFVNYFTIVLPTSRGWLVLDRQIAENKFRPQIVGVIAAEENLYVRENYVLMGMSARDVINYLEELQ